MHRTATCRRAASHTLTLALALALCVGGLAAAAPTVEPTAGASAATVPVSVRLGALSVPSDGALNLQTVVALDRPTSYLEARLQLRTPSGHLVYQKTEVRSDLETGTVAIDYARQLKDLELAPGAYPIELRVRTQSDSVREWVIHESLLVYEPGTPAVPVSIIVWVTAAPSTDADGRFVIDPASSVRARDDARRIAQWILGTPQASATLAIPGFLAEEWSRAAAGYELITPEGVREVTARDAAAQEYASTLEALRKALDTGRLELATAPYASPDIGALASHGRLDDLEDHLRRGRSAHLSAFATEPSAVLAASHGLLPHDAIAPLTRHGVAAAVVSPTSLASTGTPQASGAFAGVGEPRMDLLVTDDAASASLASSEASGLVAAAFERAISAEPSSPVIACVTLGPGQTASAGDVTAILTGLAAAPWLDYVTASQAASHATSGSVELAGSVNDLPGAPAGYWSDVNDSRSYAAAFLAAVGPNDPDAQRASDLSLLAQSGTWAGPDLNWGSAERGRSLAAAAHRIAGDALDAIELGASEITLSGASGEVPISIMNSSDKNLELRIATRTSGLLVDESVVATTQVRPQENFVTIPVDLGQSLSGRLTVEVYAADVLLDQVTVTVRASFLDRLVLIFGVAVVLVGMLLFIRRRVRNVDRAVPFSTDVPTL